MERKDEKKPIEKEDDKEARVVEESERGGKKRRNMRETWRERKFLKKERGGERTRWRINAD